MSPTSEQERGETHAQDGPQSSLAALARDHGLGRGAGRHCPPRWPRPTIRCPTRPAPFRPRRRPTRFRATPSPIPAKATTKDVAAAVDAVAQSASHSIFSINFVWTLVAGFLVMFMQAGFALVETGLIRAKNASHTMSMNFMVYALGMFGFFVCGFAFMCGGLNGTAIGGPAIARRNADAALDAHGRVGDQRRPRLGPPRHHRVLPDRQRLRRRRRSCCSSS